MKENIKIKLNVHSWLGDLTPAYDKEAGLLTITSSSITEWVYGIDIDGTVIFDINKDHILENIDILVSAELWDVTETVKKPVIKTEGKIEIEKESLLIKSFHCPRLKVLTNYNKTAISLLFDSKNTSYHGIQVSKWCVALVDQNTLIGFYIEGIKV